MSIKNTSFTLVYCRFLINRIQISRTCGYRTAFAQVLLASTQVIHVLAQVLLLVQQMMQQLFHVSAIYNGLQ